MLEALFTRVHASITGGLRHEQSNRGGLEVAQVEFDVPALRVQLAEVLLADCAVIEQRGDQHLMVNPGFAHHALIGKVRVLLDRQFTVAQPDAVWAGDITCIATDEGWLFLAVVLDLFSRQAIGWSLRQDMTRDIVINALHMAWFKRHPSKQTSLICHSDRGSQ